MTTALRAREFGDEDWSVVRFSGEEEEQFLDLLAEALLLRELHVQVFIDGVWEEFQR